MQPLTATLIVGASACATSSWLSSTSIGCIVVAGSGVRLSIEFPHHAAAHTMFSYDGPAVTYVARFNAPNCDGMVVTISGLNLLVADESPSVLLNSTHVCAYVCTYASTH